MRFLPAFLVAAAVTCHASESPAGRWEGSAQIPGRALRLVVDLSQDASGKWTGSAILPGFGIKGVPVEEISIKLPDVGFAVPDALGGLIFKARLSPEGMIAGDFQQGGNRAQFSLMKTGPAQVEPAQRSTPVKQELEGEWRGSYELGGYPRHVALKIANEPRAPAKVEFTIVGRRTNNVPINLVVQEGELLTLQSRAFQMTVEGHYRKDTDELKAVVIQGPIESPVTLRRAAKP